MRPRSHQRIGAGLIGDELTRAALLARKAYQPASSSNPEPKSSPGVPTMWFAGASQELYIPYTITRRAWQRSPPQGLYRRFTQSKRRRDTATFCSASSSPSSFFLQAGAAAHGRKVKRGIKKRGKKRGIGTNIQTIKSIGLVLATSMYGGRFQQLILVRRTVRGNIYVVRFHMDRTLQVATSQAHRWVLHVRLVLQSGTHGRLRVVDPACAYRHIRYEVPGRLPGGSLPLLRELREWELGGVPSQRYVRAVVPEPDSKLRRIRLGEHRVREKHG
mmetsp:Transcript_9816/g.26718  ORF Transcript_9816/g.26718 Transcript_9816/m.26718 type:complete len:274 (+) Transcript_9816:487-1308(+)